MILRVYYWNSIQELNLSEATVNRLQTVGLRFCGIADHALPRLRGALPAGKLHLIFCYLLLYILFHWFL